MRRSKVAGVVLSLLSSCQCQPMPEGDADSGSDAGPVEAVHDGGVDAGHDAGVEAGLVLPLFRVGPRSRFQGIYGPADLAGHFTLPVLDGGPRSFDGWVVRSRVNLGTTFVTNTWLDGGFHQASMSARVSTATSAPGLAREVFSAESPDGGTVLLATLDAQGLLEFSLESTALQALALAEVRVSGPLLSEDYDFGARSGDRPALELAVPSVMAAIRAELEATGHSGLSRSGVASPGSGVFRAIDAARATPGLPPPHVVPGSSGRHLTVVGVEPSAIALGIWPAGEDPLPIVPVSGITVPLFFHALNLEGVPLVARYRSLDGGSSPASSVFVLGPSPAPLPEGLVTEFDAGVATACGVAAGNTAVFFETSTELAVGFAAARPSPGESCVQARVPSVPLLNAAQVTPQGLVGDPGNIVFP